MAEGLARLFRLLAGQPRDDAATPMGDGVHRRLRPGEVPRFPRGQDLELAARNAVDGLYAGRHRSPRFGSSLDFADHRPYQEGDELSDIDWKAYARTDRLLVRRWHDDRQLPIALLLDTSASMAYGAPAKGAVARLTAAILGLLAHDQGDRLRLYMTAGAGVIPGAPADLCKTLDGVADRGGGAVPEQFARVAGELRERHLVLLLSDLLDDPGELLTAAAALCARGHELALLQILDPSELALPTGWGPSRFTDPEGTATSVDGEAGELAVEYAAAFAAHQERLAAGCAGLGIDHLLLPTDGALPELLGAWLGRRAQRSRR